MSADIIAVGARVQRLRERLRLTPQQIAAVAGISAWTVRALERGAAEGVGLHTLTGIAAALGVPVGVLLGERPPPIHWPVDDVFWRQVRREIDAQREVA